MSQDSRAAQSQAGPSTQQQSPLLWEKLPSIKILRPPQGRYSNKTDERCFTYCSQSIHGRLSQAEPWCRTFCIRKVFNHEVKRALAVYEEDPATHSRNLSTVDVDAKYPLPPEGQRAAQFIGSLFGNQSSSSSPSSSRDAAASEWHSVAGPSHPVDEVKYWKEGWYLWMSQSRWAAQERMDLMMCDLERQTEWQKYKEKVLEEWTSFEQGQLQGNGGPIGVGDSAMEDHGLGLNHALAVQQQQDKMAAQGQDNGHEPLGEAAGPPFPDHASQSLLIELPPALPPLNTALTKFFAPSLRLLETTRYSIESGHQARFAKQVWEKAQTREPYELAEKLLRNTWKFWTDERDPEDGNKKRS